jgi:hypothetical protein
MGDECFERKKRKWKKDFFGKTQKNVVEDDFEYFWMTKINSLNEVPTTGRWN